MKLVSTLLSVLLGIVMSCVMPTTLSATALGPGTYNLSNFDGLTPNNSWAPPFYGLRLAGLNHDGDDNFTFDFDNRSTGATGMQMTIGSNGSIRIFGKVLGGVNPMDSTANYTGKVGLWNIDFTYTTSTVSGENRTSSSGAGTLKLLGTYATGPNTTYTAGSGSVGGIASNTTINFYNDSGEIFNVLNATSASSWPYNLTPGQITGYGRLDNANYGGDCTTSNWIFNATQAAVPEAETYLMLGSMLGVALLVRHRRQRTAI